MRFIITLIFIFSATSLTAQNLVDNKYKHQIDKPDPLQSELYKVDNPCNESLYIELKKIPLDEMTDRQYEVFKQKDKACQEYLNTVETTEPARRMANNQEKMAGATNTVLIISGVAALASTIFLFTL